MGICAPETCFVPGKLIQSPLARCLTLADAVMRFNDARFARTYYLRMQHSVKRRPASSTICTCRCFFFSCLHRFELLLSLLFALLAETLSSRRTWVFEGAVGAN